MSEQSLGLKIESGLSKGAIATGVGGLGLEAAGLAIAAPIISIALFLGVSWAGMRYFLNPRRQPAH